jgi:hypoxanthine phosphoribosyltransferase
MQDAEASSRDLATKIRAFDGQPDMVVGPANGALVPAKIVMRRYGRWVRNFMNAQ